MKIKPGASVTRSVLLGADYYEKTRRHKRSRSGSAGTWSSTGHRRQERPIGDGVRLVNESGVEHADGDGFYIRNGIIIVPKSARIGEGVVV